MAVYLCNVFTTAMLDSTRNHLYSFVSMPVEGVRATLSGPTGFEQAVGHPATCAVLSQRLGLNIEPVRANVRLLEDDVLVVAQVVVPRLAEGEVLSKEQVESLPIVFWHVTATQC